uniref:hypothetical protein n=1 Tax=Hyphomonas atlantica TaxID=1280948 RepID=UPI003515ECC5
GGARGGSRWHGHHLGRDGADAFAHDAIGVIDYGQEHNLIWVTIITETGEIWCAPNPSVRGVVNWTMNRPRPAMESPH